MRFHFTLFMTVSTLIACSKSPEEELNHPPQKKEITISVDPSRNVLTSSLLLSTTFTHRTFSHTEYKTAIARAEGFLQDYTDCLGQFTMDWGAGNTNPSKDTYNFKYLDQRLELMARLGRKPLLTLCRCPEWMRRTDTSKGVDAAPRKDMYEEFGHMAADIVRNYKKKGIQIFAINVWSEVRGYWSSSLNRWELEDYADLYNITYDSIKKIDARILVGGPFMHIESSPKGKNMALYDGSMSNSDRQALVAFLNKARKMDFFAIDRNLKENNDNTPYHQDTILRYTKYNEVIHRECRELLQNKFPNVPVWVVDNQCLKGHYPANMEAAGLASMFRWHLISGAGLVDKWQPEDEGHERTDPQQVAPEGMYTHIDSNSGAQPLPTMYVFKDYKEKFPHGTQIIESKSSNEFVEALASPTHIMLINKQSTERKVTIEIKGDKNRNKSIALKSFEVTTISY